MLSVLLALILVQGDSVPAERRAARDWYQDARFGMFIHWGVYSLLGQGEWVMQNRPIAVADYEWLAGTFNPVKFDARAWVALAKAAGMKYITITSRHHDGFAMFGSKVSRYNIVDWTPFHRDPLKELADECRRQGLKLFFYYSQLDWHNPDYWPRGATGHGTGRPDHGDWNAYLDFLDGQLTELLTNYGPVGGIWFDGMWDKPDADWRLPRTYALIHRLQPATLIIPNHHQAPLPGEDVQTFEQDLPGANTAGFNTRTIGGVGPAGASARAATSTAARSTARAPARFHRAAGVSRPLGTIRCSCTCSTGRIPCWPCRCRAEDGRPAWGRRVRR